MAGCIIPFSSAGICKSCTGNPTDGGPYILSPASLPPCLFVFITSTFPLPLRSYSFTPFLSLSLVLRSYLCNKCKQLKSDSDHLSPQSLGNQERARRREGDCNVILISLSYFRQCPSCPVVRPIFLCGSDNRTYSSLCRLHYHNCIHDAAVRIACKGFCPCRGESQTHL